MAEATVRSGSLVTARLALDLGREVYAVPGRIFDPRAAGPNLLIRDGAALVQRPRDLIESLPTAVRERLDESPRAKPGGGSSSDDARELLALMVPGEESSTDGLAETAGLAVEAVLALLLELELAGEVRRGGGASYIRKA